MAHAENFSDWFKQWQVEVEIGQIDKFPCPKCGEDWLYDWEKLSLLKDFLAKQKIWRCAKCKTIFSLTK